MALPLAQLGDEDVDPPPVAGDALDDLAVVSRAQEVLLEDGADPELLLSTHSVAGDDLEVLVSDLLLPEVFERARDLEGAHRRGECVVEVHVAQLLVSCEYKPDVIIIT